MNGVGELCRKSQHAHINPQNKEREANRQLDPIQLFCIQLYAVPIWRQREGKAIRLCQGIIEWRLMCILMAEFMKSQCLHISYICSPLTECALTLVCVRGFPFASVAVSHREGKRGLGEHKDCRGTTHVHLHLRHSLCFTGKKKTGNTLIHFHFWTS